MKKLSEIIKREKPQHIISVGDVVSQNMLKHGIQPDIIIVDNKVMREQIKPVQVTAKQTVNVKNPPGTITPETWKTMRDAVKRKTQTKVLVDGEEDLLTLVAVLEAADNSFVVYGQPNEGVVAVRVDKTTRDKVQRIIVAMKPVAKRLK